MDLILSLTPHLPIKSADFWHAPYSPNFNPIETAFSTIKSWIKRNRDFMESCDDPIYALLVACSQITPQMAQSFFESSIYL